uniref:Uncharacterized protein n=1 Tax=Cacopsylla melanoneura TaxID=428564 RepID=A0A8D8YCF3_9HEMI
MQPGLRFCLKCGNFSSRALAVFHIKYLGHVCERSNECAIPLIYSLFAHTPCSVCTASYKTCIPNFTGPSSYLPTYNFVTTHLDTFCHSVSRNQPLIIRYTVHQYSFEVQSRRKAGPKTKVSGDSLYPLLPNLHFSSFRHGLPFSC